MMLIQWLVSLEIVFLSSPKLVWDLDVSGIKDLKANLKVMMRNHIDYGIVNKDIYPSGDERAGTYVAQIAAAHEFGLTKNLPPRPFFTQSVHRKGKKLARQIARHLFEQALTRQVDETDLKINADLLADTIRDTIDEQDFWFLAPSTLSKRRGKGVYSTEILKDTNTLYDSFTGKVVRGKLSEGG